MKIILKSIHLVNFKGIRDLELAFEPGTNNVSGANGTGKTTIFDAFTWLLFGKDSQGRSDSNFSIKTLDEQGKAMPKLEHSVSVVMDVDGKELKLKRVYREKWEKPNGTTKEVLKNHETLFYVNDVKQPTKREYEAKIASLIDESVFKMVTNPFYFTNLKPEEQKAMLLDMAGDVTDDDIARMKPEFADFLKELEGTDIVEKAKEVKAKKTACKDELSLIPTKIETADKLKPEAEDWEAIEKELKDKKDELAYTDALLHNDKTAKNAQLYEQRNQLQQQINEKKLEESKRVGSLRVNADSIYNENVRNAEKVASDERARIRAIINNVREELAKREGEVKASVGKEYNEASMKLTDMESAIPAKRAAIKGLEASKAEVDRDIADDKKDIADVEQSIKENELLLDDLRKQYYELQASSVAYDPTAFICPTCKRPLEEEDVEAKRMEIENNFNAEKAEKIKKNAETGKAEKAKLDELKAKRDRLTKRMQERESKSIELEQSINHAYGELKVMETELVSARANVPSAPDYDACIEKDEVCQKYRAEISKYEAEHDAVAVEPVSKPDYSEVEKSDSVLIQIKNDITQLQNELDSIKEPEPSLFDGDSDLEGKKKQLMDDIEKLNQRMGKKEVIERADKEIEEFEVQSDNLNAKIAELEGWEYQALQFQKAKDAELLRRINGLFSYVSFSFVSSQLNGGEKLTCVCTVNGKPYPDVNNAGKINAGLDIINAICKAKGVCAPIFVDNAESVNDVLATESQKVLLYVTRDNQLTINN